MVNAAKVLKARKSKRQPLRLKHKIERKVREHHRKERRDKKKNPEKYKKRDPGIPNSWPFKLQLIQQQEAQKEAIAAQREASRLARIRAKAVERQQEAALKGAIKQTAQQRRDERRKAASFAKLPELLAEADVLLLVLDARDPHACRSHELEAALQQCGKLVVFLLNKVDLVPTAVAAKWTAALSAELPTLPSIATAGEAATPPLAALLSARRGVVGGELTVGVVGFDRVGKRSVVHALSMAKMEGVRVLPMPALLSPALLTYGCNDILLRRIAPELVPQPELVVEALLERCERRSLLRHFEVANFEQPSDFLISFAAKQDPEIPLTRKKGRVDVRPAAIAFLKLLSSGKMPFFTLPSSPSKAAGNKHAELLGKRWKPTPMADELVATSPSEASCVVLTPGSADEIEISDAQDEAFGVDDMEGESEEGEGEEDLASEGEEEDCEDDEEEEA